MCDLDRDSKRLKIIRVLAKDVLEKLINIMRHELATNSRHILRQLVTFVLKSQLKPL